MGFFICLYRSPLQIIPHLGSYMQEEKTVEETQ